MNVYDMFSQILPYFGLFCMICLFLLKQKHLAKQAFLLSSGLALVCSLIGLCLEPKLDFILSGLILFVSLNIQQYSKQYFDGDSNITAYFIKLALLSCSANSMVFASSHATFAFFWVLNNLCLVALMVHQSKWLAQKNAGIFTLLSLGFGSISLALSFILFDSKVEQYQQLAQVLLVLGAMFQSAIWPFHRWLISSLNSPTPVSALMHAGIVNGGGIVLIKYHSFFIHNMHIMHAIFVLGLITAILGGFWKLIQVDIKKMLANSTMAQMGFMFIQCGLGLFPAAAAHLIWHGLFKAYLFLNSGTAVKGKFNCPEITFKPIRYIWVIVATFLAVVSFVFTAHINLSTPNTYWFMLGIVAISAWQLSHGLVGKNHAVLDISLVAIFSGIYGITLRFIESCFIDGHELALTLDPVFISGFGLLFGIWILLNAKILSKIKQTRFWAWLYITSLNQSQPRPNCISSIRNDIKA